MTPQEAYRIVKRRYPNRFAESCMEYRDFYLFSMIPYKFLGATSYVGGSVFDAVDKKTGKISQYDILADIEAYHNAKIHEVEDPILKLIGFK